MLLCFVSMSIVFCECFNSNFCLSNVLCKKCLTNPVQTQSSCSNSLVFRILHVNTDADVLVLSSYNT